MSTRIQGEYYADVENDAKSEETTPAASVDTSVLPVAGREEGSLETEGREEGAPATAHLEVNSSAPVLDESEGHGIECDTSEDFEFPEYWRSREPKGLESEESDAYVVDGYTAFLIDRLTRLCRETGKVRVVTSRQVRAIHRHAAGVVVSTVSTKGHGELSDAAGEEERWFGSAVVVTVPVGCLKQKSIQFVPELSSNKLESIEKIGMGYENKIILRFKAEDAFFGNKQLYIQSNDQRFRFM